MKIDRTGLAPFQFEDALTLARERGRFVLGHKTGLGKTVMALMGLEELERLRGSPVSRILIVGSGSSIPSWTRQLKQYAGITATVLDSSNQDGLSNWPQMMKQQWGPCVVVMTHTRFRRLSPVGSKTWPTNGYWDAVIVDEAHKVLRNRQTQTFKVLKAASLRCMYFIPITATWLSRGIQEAWATLNCLAPKLFPSYWSFVNTFCYTVKDNFGTEICGPKNLPAFKEQMKHFYKSRTWEEVNDQLPINRRDPIFLDMTAEERADYEEFEQEMVLEMANDEAIVAPSILAKIVRMRQLTSCPWIFGLPYIGAIWRYLLEELEEESHTVIYMPFKVGMDGAEKILKEAGHANVFCLYGGITAKVQDERIAAWKATKGIMLCSVQYAQSFALDTCRVAYFAGFSYDPQDNVQCEGRHRRMDSAEKFAMLFKYLITRNTVDDDVKEIVNGKVVNVSQAFKDIYGRPKNSR